MTFTPLSLLSLVAICHNLCSCCNKVAAQGPADDGAIQHIDLVLAHQETNTEIPHDVMEDFDRQRAICQLLNSSSGGRATYHRGSTSLALIHSTSQNRQRGRTPPLLEHHTPPFRPRVAETSTKHAPPFKTTLQKGADPKGNQSQKNN